MMVLHHICYNYYKEIELSSYYVSFDESLNKSLQRGQMDILVSYWNADTNIAETRYLKSEFVGGANAEQISLCGVPLR